jgi:hypothetical protein
MVIIIIKTFYKSALTQQRNIIPESGLDNGSIQNDTLLEFTNIVRLQVNKRVTQKRKL